MSTEVICRVEGGKLVARTPHDAATLAEMEGGEYRAVLTVPNGRSVPQMRLFHKFCEIIADNHPGGFTKKNVIQVLKIEAGACDARKLADGTYALFPRSIAFNAMGAAEFSQFMDLAFAAAAEKFGADLSAAARDELDRMASPMLRAAA